MLIEKSLIDMAKGSHGIITRIEGGHRLFERLKPLGVSIGQKIYKVESMIMKGPIIVKLGNSKVAIGRGMASKIIVSMEEDEGGK
ncbi:MAG: FeoA family protein [bacterium]